MGFNKSNFVGRATTYDSAGNITTPGSNYSIIQFYAPERSFDLQLEMNAAAELAAMVSGFVIGLTTSVVPIVRIDDYGLKLLVTTTITAVVWLTVLLLTPPEAPDVLERFVRQVRPPGPGWRTFLSRLEDT